ncbi:hypothetical protein EJ03DRAFT_373320 [Teratosphaeria nubilosa]|uniref:Uncharacterized protein n=1 Tax=Teratosphaeria nubilosa TaxID=161662 RepID=A0A6G1LEL0_9PEZI|nr:hypothetical protein EJ03DRAFT_373320 [Teratosphaeria nubilosa]
MQATEYSSVRLATSTSSTSPARSMYSRSQSPVLYYRVRAPERRRIASAATDCSGWSYGALQSLPPLSSSAHVHRALSLRPLRCLALRPNSLPPQTRLLRPEGGGEARKRIGRARRRLGWQSAGSMKYIDGASRDIFGAIGMISRSCCGRRMMWIPRSCLILPQGSFIAHEEESQRPITRYCQARC